MTLIVFAGPACSGKSTLAAEIARRRGWPHLSMDATRQRLMPDAKHTRADREVAYRAMLFAAELLLAAGSGAVLDAPFGHAEDRSELERIARGNWKLIECRVPAEAAAKRLRARGIPDPSRPDLTEERVIRLNREYRYSGDGLLLDTDRLSVEECLARVEQYIAA
ncbi:MAG TPA: ATP-binding protein [Bryobacteraceae bacterium]|nr:ATP-binding protein [Bryobacteraceae bacterium]